MAIFGLELGTFVAMRHHQRQENPILGGRFAHIFQGKLVAVAAITTSDGAHATVVTVLVPAEEVDADEIHAQIVIVLEESVDIFLGSLVRCHNPVEPGVGSRRMHHLVGAGLVTERPH